MRVAYDGQIFVTQEYGGISRYFFEIARRIAGMPDCDVRVLSYLTLNRYLKSGGEQLLPPGAMPLRLLRTARFPAIALPPRRLVRLANATLSRAYMARWKPDIVHETYYYNTRGKPKAVRTVVTVYDMIDELFPQFLGANSRDPQRKRLAAERADHIMCISDATKRDLVNLFGVSPAKISVTPLGCSFAPADRHEPATRRATPFLLFVGDRVGYKNFDGLLRAYGSSPRLMKDYQLVCFGGGKLRPAEITLIRELAIPVQRVVQLSGDDRRLSALYAEARVFVYPSLYEGFGLPPLEAMACRCPVACSSGGATPEVVGDAAVLFDPRDTESMRHAIELLANDEATRTRLVQKGLARVALFTWDACARGTREVYASLL